jgi:hypothetical protein
VPSCDINVYIVLDDFGKIGRAYRATDEADANLETVITDMMEGQYNYPMRVVAFNTSEGWSRDVSEDVAWEVVNRLRSEGKTDFLTFHIGENDVATAENLVI